MKSNFYTYAYLREDGTPYYIGKGQGKRAYKKHIRKNGINITPPRNRILILKKNLTEDNAFKHEKYMISVFGRKDLGTGILINMTDGGDGASGSIVSNDRRQKVSERFSKSFKLVNPELKLVEGHHIGKFCKKYNLTQEVVSQILSGKRISHKGWSHPDRPLSCKIFYIKNPEGKIFCFGDVDEFCTKHKLPKTNTYDVLVGRRKTCNDGWYSINYEVKKYKLINPNGEIVVYRTNDRGFCTRNNLNRDLLKLVINKKAYHTGGWKLL